MIGIRPTHAFAVLALSILALLFGLGVHAVLAHALSGLSGMGAS